MNSETTAQLQPAQGAADRRRSILIVDDDPHQVEALAYRLNRQGFTTVHAFEGRNGLKLARQHRPDLVLLDLQLPDLDGFAVCEELVDSPDLSACNQLILSSSVSSRQC